MSSCSRTRTKAPRSARIRVSSSPAKIVADLDDVLLHILSFLPIKTLIKCKRVSKRWRSLITNPNFSNRIISSKHPLPISGLYLKGTRDIEYRFVSLLDDDDEEVNEQLLSLSSSPLRFADHPTPIIVMQSTNGLLLCKCTCPPNHFNRNFYVYNPTTKQKTLLPRIIDHVALSLAFDPSKSPHYKVFCLRKSSISSSVSPVSPVSSVSSVSPVSSVSSVFYHVEVYSSNEGPWRRLVSVPSFALPQTVTDLSNTVFWNGAVHWFWFGPNSRDCLSFDIDTEEIKTLPLPYLDHHQDDDEDPPDVGTLRFIEESRGNLYFIEVNDLSSSDLSVYEMNRTGLTWFLKYHVDLEPLAAAFPEMIRTEYYTYRKIYSFSVIGFVKGETDAESSYIVLHIPNKAVKYYFISKTFKKLCSFEPSQEDGGENFYGFRRSFQFIESLANV